MNKGWLAGALERAKLMTISVLAPEVIVGWAADQLRVVREVRRLGKERNDLYPSKLTMAHGFFVSMGGFYDSNTEEILTLDSLEQNPKLVKELEKIDELSIQDKSEGGTLSKTLSIVQIS
ncbi:uncharacterized protein ARMOST_22077 [Armillaria ostoyae]|uniref:Uncharacterized protein n=1 Tax=Armillaria ostoyae TaxID=47428 RepID=A0A284SBU2_ARMOS|nr:uncharacterized protein ARMOST_22077 [Armillaria ostoyae]